jgi:hypothetical protein
MTKDELELLRSYENGPRIWDATAVLPDVYALEAQGLVEQVGNEGFLYQLTEAGRAVLAARLTIEGKGNDGKPRQEFADRLAAADEAGFLKIAEDRIWLSAYAANNRRSDYHWQADACYDEAQRRSRPDLYKRAWEQASGMKSS